jgi:hypothetical protein
MVFKAVLKMIRPILYTGTAMIIPPTPKRDPAIEITKNISRG